MPDYVQSNRRIRLAYATNAHPSETAGEQFAYLQDFVIPICRRLQASGPRPVSLRMGAAAAREFRESPARLAELQALLASATLDVMDMNGFPYGNFHGVAVKENVFQPDWTSPERLRYTQDLIDVMARLVAPGGEGSISTLSSYPRGRYPDDSVAMAAMRRHHMLAAWACAKVERECGKRIRLGLEVEPYLRLQTAAELGDYLCDMLHLRGPAELSLLAKCSEDEARSALILHLGVCFDTCHHAVVFEDAVAALDQYQSFAVPIVQMQLSNALDVRGDAAQAERALSAWREPVYLHQVFGADAEGRVCCSAVDIPGLETLPPDRTRAAARWRSHYHVPLHAREIRGCATTGAETEAALTAALHGGAAGHFVIETYTWETLEKSPARVIDGIVAEFEAVDRMLGRAGWLPASRD